MTYDPDLHPLVLLVEDEALIRFNGVDILEDAGYSVIEAASADEAIALLERAPEVKLVFSDVDMPGSMDGLALVELVHSRWPGVRLLLTSGHRQFADRDLPDDGRFLAKPYSSQCVVDHIRDLLKP